MTQHREPGLLGKAAGAVTGSIVEAVPPEVILDHLDLDALLDRIDVNALLSDVQLEPRPARRDRTHRRRQRPRGGPAALAYPLATYLSRHQAA